MANQAVATEIALMLLSEALAGDEEGQGHIQALRARLAEQRREATTVVDDYGNITIGLKPVGMAVELAAMR